MEAVSLRVPRCFQRFQPSRVHCCGAAVVGAQHWRGNLHHVDLEPFQHRIRSIPCKRGDLLIWHRACPHGNGYNLTDPPRLAQFINFSIIPEQEDRQTGEQQAAAIAAREEAGQPELNELGRRLAGLEQWPAL